MSPKGWALALGLLALTLVQPADAQMWKWKTGRLVCRVAAHRTGSHSPRGSCAPPPPLLPSCCPCCCVTLRTGQRTTVSDGVVPVSGLQSTAC
jgi:hypothetical protein